MGCLIYIVFGIFSVVTGFYAFIKINNGSPNKKKKTPAPQVGVFFSPQKHTYSWYKVMNR
jgi:hypothetical protein